MRRLLLITFLLCVTNGTFASESLEGNYLCRYGFLSINVSDTLSVQTSKAGNLAIAMNDAFFLISPDCQIKNNSTLQVLCEDNKITIKKAELQNKVKTMTTLSFEKIKGIVIVKEEIKTNHSNDLSVLICRAVK